MFKNLFKWNKEDKAKEDEITLEEQEDALKEDLNNISDKSSTDEEERPKLTFFDKLMAGLDKTRKNMTNKIDGLLKSYGKIDEELFDDLEEILVTADVGVNTTMKIIDRVKDRVKQEKVSDPKDVKDLLKEEIKDIMKEFGG